MISNHTNTSSTYKKPGFIQPAYSVNSVSVSSDKTSEPSHRFVFDIYISENFGSYTKIGRIKALPSISNWSTIEFSDLVKTYVESQFIHESPKAMVDRAGVVSEDIEVQFVDSYLNMVRVKVLAGEEYRVGDDVVVFNGFNEEGDPALKVSEFYSTYQAISSNSNETFRVKQKYSNEQIQSLHFNYMDFISLGVNNQTVWTIDGQGPVGDYRLGSESLYNPERNQSLLDKSFVNARARYLSNQPLERKYSMKAPSFISYIEGRHVRYDQNINVDTTQAWKDSYLGKSYDEWYKTEGLEDWYYYNMFNQRIHTIGYEFYDIKGNVLDEILYQPDSNIFGNPMKTGMADNVGFPGYDTTSGSQYNFSEFRQVQIAAYPQIVSIDKFAQAPNADNSLLSFGTNYGLWNVYLSDFIKPKDRSSWNWISEKSMLIEDDIKKSGEMRDDCFVSEELGNSLSSTPNYNCNFDFEESAEKPFPFRNQLSSYSEEGTFLLNELKTIPGVVTGQQEDYNFEHYFGLNTRFRMVINAPQGPASHGEVRVKIRYADNGTYGIKYDSGWTGYLNSYVDIDWGFHPHIYPSYTESLATSIISERMLGSDTVGGVPFMTGQGRYDRLFVEVSMRNVTYATDQRVTFKLFPDPFVGLQPWYAKGNEPDLWHHYEQNYLEMDESAFDDYNNLFDWNNGRTDSEIITISADVEQLTESHIQPRLEGWQRNLLDIDFQKRPNFRTGTYSYVPYIEMMATAGFDATTAEPYSWFQPMLIANHLADYDFSVAVGLVQEINGETIVDNISRYMTSAIGIDTLFNLKYTAANGLPPIQVLSQKSLPAGKGNSGKIWMTVKLNYGGNTPTSFNFKPIFFQGTRSAGEEIRFSNIKVTSGTLEEDVTRLYGAYDYKLKVYDTTAPTNLIKPEYADSGTLQANIDNLISTTSPLVDVTYEHINVKDTPIQYWWNDEIDGFFDEANGEQIGTPRMIAYGTIGATNTGNVFSSGDLGHLDDLQLYHSKWLNVFDIYGDNQAILYDNMDRITIVWDMMVYVTDNGVADNDSHLHINHFPIDYNSTSVTPVREQEEYTSSDRGTWKRVWTSQTVTTADAFSIMKTDNTSQFMQLRVVNDVTGAFNSCNIGISDIRMYFIPFNVADSKAGIQGYVNRNYVNSKYQINNFKEPYFKRFNDLKMNNAYSLYWLNPYGQWDTYRFTGKSSKTIDTNRNQRGVGLDKTGDLTWFYGRVKQNYGDNIDFNVNAIEVYELRSDYLKDAERTWLEECMVSPKMFLLDENTGYYQRVNNLTGDYTNFVQKNNKLYQLSLEVQVSQERRTQQVLGLK